MYIYLKKREKKKHFLHFQEQTSTHEVLYRIQMLRIGSVQCFLWLGAPAGFKSTAFRDSNTKWCDAFNRWQHAVCACVAEYIVNVLHPAGRLSLPAWEWTTQRAEVVAQARDWTYGRETADGR